MADVGRREFILGGAGLASTGLFQAEAAAPSAVQVNPVALATQLLTTPPQNWDATQLRALETAAPGTLQRVVQAVPQAQTALTNRIGGEITRADNQERAIAGQVQRLTDGFQQREAQAAARAQDSGRPGDAANVERMHDTDQRNLGSYQQRTQALAAQHDADPTIGSYMQAIHSGATDAAGAKVQASQDIGAMAATTLTGLRQLQQPAPVAPAPVQAPAPSVAAPG